MNSDNNSDSSQTDQVFGGLRKPVWDEWRKVKQARLWQAVALACNIDPSNFQLGGLSLVRLFSNQPTEFDDLLTMAKGSIGAGGILKPLPQSVGTLEEREVKLSNFAAWLKTVPHKPPSEFPWHPEAIALSNMNWPWGRHETHLLRKLAAAADKFWTQYLPDDPSTAPTNQQVIDWLKEQGVTVRTAEIMATILRADGLPSGPRK